MGLGNEEIKQQSMVAYTQWGPQWAKQAKEHAQYEMKPLKDFNHIGIGRACLLIANGYSFEEKAEEIKQYQDRVDIMVCDKTLGKCLDLGIQPDYLMVCDANVDYDKYLKPWADQLKDIVLFQNVCANPKWAEPEYRDRYFFVNKDVLNSEKEFSQISGCKNFIPAGTNVSNAMLILLTQCDNNGRNNFFGYDKYILAGFDYSWESGGSYYAFSKDAGGKVNYMKHVNCINNDEKYSHTSNNLLFSMKWFQEYISTFKLPVVNCSKKSIVSTVKYGELSEQTKYNYRKEDSKRMIEATVKLNILKSQIVQVKNIINEVMIDHHYNFLKTT